jgi:hypothetical protein
VDRPIARTEHLIFEEVLDESVIYNAEEKKVHNLNSTLTWIWRRCNGESTVQQIAADFGRQFETDNALEIVVSGLRQLQSSQLVDGMTNLGEMPESSVSRRSVVTAGSVLLPAMISVLAPPPAAAKSKPDKETDNGHGHKKDKGED